MPQRIAPTMITETYAAAALRPTSAATVVSDIAFIAGPTIRKTNAAPGETPFATSDAAIGMDAVEQTYIGKPTSAITGIAIQSLPWNASAKKLSGTSTVTSAETASPTASGFATEPRILSADSGDHRSAYDARKRGGDRTRDGEDRSEQSVCRED